MTMPEEKALMYHKPKRRLITRIEDLEKELANLISSHKDLMEAARMSKALVDLEWSQKFEDQAQETLSRKT